MAGVTLRRIVRIIVLVLLGARGGGGCDHKDTQAPEPQPVAMVFSECTMCHVDLQEQLVIGAHGSAGLTCASCHGESRGHVTDEHNEVKPDRRFTEETATGLCGECHADHLGKAEAAGPAANCVQCHGVHDILAGKRAKKMKRRLRLKKPH
jgi:hypothetical protein